MIRIHRFISNEYKETYDPTVEDWYKKTLMCKGRPVQLEIIDTAGRELVSEMLLRYILTADAFIVVYSVGSRKSYQHAIYLFSQIAQIRVIGSIARLLVATMCDSIYREVSPEEGNALSAQLRCSFAEVSAKRNVNIQEIFEETVSLLLFIENMRYSKEDVQQNQKLPFCCFF
ncbi:Ras family protein [Dictyocaulus viviparus]|uniref:Ras family protein n=1 Tax=Dictyocaulus viviparus TaxID=29172 RepID=A0A0D8XMS0_DICVI|nr:Ras family protein [Dictyocaulus viviparus]